MTVAGDSGSRWLLRREKNGWQLYIDGTYPADAEVTIDQDRAWRLFTRGISKDEALSSATLTGDHHLASKALETISVIA
jgi:hypothetical protein